LGGRDQVLATPFVEALKYLELTLKQKVSDRWNNYMDMLYAHPMGVDNDKRKKYMELIQPQQERQPMEMKTDIDHLKELKRRQDEKMKAMNAKK
jgi:hypothetical protein